MSRSARQPENGPRAYAAVLGQSQRQPLYKSLAVMTSCSESQPYVCPVTDLQRICS